MNDDQQTSPQSGAGTDPPRPDDDWDLRDARRRADEELVKAVRNAGSSSTLARHMEEELRDLGVGALMNLYSKGALFRSLGRKRIFLPSPPPPGFQRNDCRSLVHIAVLSATPQFMESAVFGGAWNPRGGASLSSFFVSKCLYAFVDEYRLFRRAELPFRGSFSHAMPLHEMDELADSPATSTPPINPETRTLDRAEVESLVRKVAWSPEDRILIFRIAQGFTHREIADELGITESSLNSKLRRIRKRARESSR